MKISEVAALPSVADVVKFLKNESPDDELFSLRELSEKFNISESTLKNSPYLKPYKISHGGKNYYGSTSAIADFERQTK
jgi:hypothetical protein